MKKSLLSLFALFLSFVGIQAQSWTAPVLQYSAESIPAKAYIYNVEQSKFLTKGGAWGTHASIKADVSAAFMYEIQDQGDGSYVLYCSAAANTGKLGRNSETDVYTDYKSGDWGLTWEFVKSETGYYRIRTAASNPIYGSDRYTEDDTNYGLYELGWNANGDDLTNGNGASMGTNDGVYMGDPENGEGWSFDWAFVTEEIYALYNAHFTLYNKLNEAFEIGYAESELSTYAALLESEDVEAINAAVTEVDNLILNYAYNHATPDNPFDITSKIVNPTLEGARGAAAAGWTDEFGNMLIQNNKAYNLVDDEGNDMGEFGLNNFAQNWTSSNTDPIAESHLYQTVTDLPQGTYILTVDAIATSASANLEVSGAEIYAESGAIHYSQNIDKNPYGGAGSGSPHRYSLFVTHMGGDLTIGAHFTPGYVKWFAVDNFKLAYAGPVDNPGLVALTGSVGAAQPYVDEYDEKYVYSETTFNTLKEELENAYDVMSGSSEECMTEATTINELMTNVKAEVAAYGRLKTFVERVAADVVTYENIEELSATLSDMKDMYEGAYDDNTATIVQINDWINAYDAVVLDGVKAAMANATIDKPVDVSILGVNLGWADNTDKGWTHQSTTGHWNVRAHTAEVWNSNFDCHQTIADLPAGLYVIKSNALYRTAANDVMSEDDEILTCLYAGKSTAKVPNLTTGWSEEPYYSNDYHDEVSGLYLPNSMEGASVAFAQGKYECEVSSYLTEDGSLTFGIKNEGEILDDAWSIWGTFHVLYCGKSNSGLYDQVLALKTSAKGMMDAVAIVAAADTKLNDAIASTDNVSAMSSEDELMTVIHDLESAIAYANKSVTLLDEIMAKYEVYNNKLGEYESSDEAFPALIDKIGAAISDEAFESNEQIEGWLAALAKGWTAYIQFDHLNATEENPEDITAVIVNAGFDTHDATGWTYTKTGDGHVGGGQAEASGALETWNTTSMDLHQTIVGLADGFYRISCIASYRNGNNEEAVAAQYYNNVDSISALAQLYANETSVNVKSVYEGAQAEALGVDGEDAFTYNGTSYYIPNTMVSMVAYAQLESEPYRSELVVCIKDGQDLTLGLRHETTAKCAWFVFDNFTLEYLGNQSPTAIEAVEAAQNTVSATGIFDLAGRKVSKAVKGIYIINGKKVVK